MDEQRKEQITKSNKTKKRTNNEEQIKQRKEQLSRKNKMETDGKYDKI
jgi:hypothetical protein